MTIWALKGPSTNDYNPEEYQQVTKFLTKSIRSGISRFGWGNFDEADLRILGHKQLQDMNEDEQLCWVKANFLIDVVPGDWVVHINLPYWGACLAAQVVSGYEFEATDNELSDYRHQLKIDTNTLVEFERNDEAVLPIINTRLKLQGNHWRINQVEDFLQTIKNLQSEDIGKKEDESVGIFYIKNSLPPMLQSFTANIQKIHPGGKLEALIAQVFRKVPNVKNVHENGKTKGWGTDHGADLIVTYKAGLGVANLEKEELLVVQVKSYQGEHWETNAVQQTETAITKYAAHAGLIVSTAKATENLQKAIEELSKKLDKPIALIAGEDVAKFIFRYASDLVL